MVTRKKIHRRFTSHRGSKSNQLSCRVEPLEGRTLLSAWGTVFAGNSVNGGDVQSMASDAAGNVYALGYTTDANPNDPGISMVWEKPAGGSWQQLTSIPGADAVAVDKLGNLFFTGQSNNNFTTWELAKGSNTVVTIDSYYNGGAQGRAMAFDSSGNLYTVGSDAPLVRGVGYPHFLTRRGTFANSKWSFSTVDEVDNKLQIMDTAYSVVAAPSGVYVAGLHAHTWIVRGSATGAAGTWTTVDSFALDSSANSSAHAIMADAAGHLYVAGTAQTTTLIPGSRPKAYHLTNWWVVRESNTGAAGTWSTIDNSQTSWPSAEAGDAWAITQDAAGNIYVAGGAYVTSGGESGVVRVRSAANGSWATSDVAPVSDYYHAITSDSFGNVYAGGEAGDPYSNPGDYFIRSLPAAPANLTATPDPVLPSSQIDLSWTNAAGSDQSGFAIYRSTDDVNFSLVTTVSSSVASYNDSSLTAGTTYFYYVVTLLNSVDGSPQGSSAASNTASAST